MNRMQNQNEAKEKLDSAVNMLEEGELDMAAAHATMALAHSMLGIMVSIQEIEAKLTMYASRR